MKKILALVSLLTLAAACATQPAGNKDATTSANSNANKSAEMKTMAGPSEADIIAKEKAAWDAFKKKDADAFGKLLAADYIEVTDRGVTDKAAAIAGMKDFDLSDVSYSDWKTITIDKDAAIVYYNATIKGTEKGTAVPSGPYHEMSVYVNRNGEWLAVFYQETAQSNMPPPPPPKEAPKANPSGSPGQPGPDATANEKMVWDAFKSRNFDAFASYLANDFIEVEEGGVFDKQASVKSAQSFDFSKIDLSGWKVVKVNDNASIVTYVLTMPGAPKEFHSSVWANRNGKWAALFHQGTTEQSGSAADKK
ncbi:MAG TPA: nuclear transport factor 2 family protein [Pyrinomonadaceae bacterium]|nr:nuclear transport factor 2 family protein [Pyrinomonadaceae bacterium]